MLSEGASSLLNRLKIVLPKALGNLPSVAKIRQRRDFKIESLKTCVEMPFI